MMTSTLQSLALLALLALVAAEPILAQGHFYYGRNKVQYEDFDWHVLRTANFDIYYDGDAAELAEIGAAEAEATYRQLVHRFGIELRQRVPLLFYATNLHFRQTNVVPGFIPPGVGGFFEFGKGRVVIPADGDIHRFRHVIRHELVHVFTFTRISQVIQEHRRPQLLLPPLWFTEGLAEYWSGEPDHMHEIVMRDAVASNLLVRLEDLHRVGGFLIYKQGESVCRFISEVYGEEKLLMLIENAWRDSDFRAVMEHVLRQDFRTISERYDQWVRRQYYPILGRTTPGSLVATAVAESGYSGKPAVIPSAGGGRSIVYLGNTRGYTNVYAAEIDRAGRPVGDPEVLIRGERGPRFEMVHAFESRMDASPNGRLAFVTQSGPSDVIHVYDFASGRLHGTYRPPGLVAVYSPAWSPDRQQLVLTGIDHTGFADLYIFDLQSETLERLTSDPFDARDPHWSPCGRWVVFSSDRGPNGRVSSYNLFVLDLESGRIRQLTHGERQDRSPRWSRDGRQIVFTSASRDDRGRYGGQDIWVLEPDLESHRPSIERRLTTLTSAAFDPLLTADDHLVFAAYERGRFTVRNVSLDSLGARRELAFAPAASTGGDPDQWVHPRHTEGDGQRDLTHRYRRSYSLDIAQGGLATNPIWGTSGGGALALSDLLGDDQIIITGFVADVPGRSFVDGLNVGVTRINRARRTNIGYGAFRLSGLRFDRTDPDAHAGYPVFFEQMAGGFAAVSYPLSRFQRVELSGLLAWNRKELPATRDYRDAVLVSPSVSLTHDNALYSANGPIEGWKGQLTAGLTSDVFYSNVGYYSLSADVRHYLRLGRHVTLASWGLARTHRGEEARLWVLGGSWDLRGYPFMRVRGRNQWFTSHELRFTIADAPSAHLPLLTPFGISNVRGAVFIDAARAWNDHYYQREAQLLTGRTLGSAGAGVRVNIFGGIVLRYDLGWRFDDGFVWGNRQPFRQFFFGYDF